jgi:hypothetical protein
MTSFSVPSGFERFLTKTSPKSFNHIDARGLEDCRQGLAGKAGIDFRTFNRSW